MVSQKGIVYWDRGDREGYGSSSIWIRENYMEEVTCHVIHLIIPVNYTCIMYLLGTIPGACPRTVINHSLVTIFLILILKLKTKEIFKILLLVRYMFIVLKLYKQE